MKKKILFVVDEFFPISTAGAARMNSFLKECAKTYDVALLCGREQESSTDNIPEVTYYCLQRPNEKSKFAPFIFAWYFLRFNQKLVQLSRNFNLVYVSIPRYEFLYGITRLKKKNISYILDIRDLLESKNYELIFQRFLPTFAARSFAKILEKQNKRMLKKAIGDSVLTTVAYKGLYTLYTQTFPQFKEKIKYIPNGVDLDYFPKIQKKNSTEKLQLLYIGNFAEKDYLAPIIKELGKFQGKEKLEIIFVGDGRKKQDIERLVKEQGLGQQTRFLGKKHHKEIYTLAEKADIGIILRDPELPTLLPVSVVEYMALSLPVIVNDYSELGEFVRETNAGYIIKEPSELNQLLFALLTKQKELENIGKINRRWIEENGSRGIIAKKFREEIVEKSL